jgi:hypothetical protein
MSSAGGPAFCDEPTIPPTADRSGHRPEYGRSAPTGGSPPPLLRSGAHEVLKLQRLAGNHAVARAIHGPASKPTVQRDTPTGAGTSLAYQGQVLTTDVAQLTTVLGSLITTRGQDEADTFAYGFLRMGFPERQRREPLGGGGSSPTRQGSRPSG